MSPMSASKVPNSILRSLIFVKKATHKTQMMYIYSVTVKKEVSGPARIIKRSTNKYLSYWTTNQNKLMHRSTVYLIVRITELLINFESQNLSAAWIPSWKLQTNKAMWRPPEFSRSLMLYQPILSTYYLTNWLQQEA